jgi:hypothetical protein
LQKKLGPTVTAAIREGGLRLGSYEYYQAIWKIGGYNPSNDADNLSYIK